MVSRDIDDVVGRMEEHMETLASPLAPTTMSVEDEELLVEILGTRNGYGHAGRPAGSRMVAVDDGTGDDEDGGGGLSRWYKQTDIASEMSQRTLNSIIEDADLSDPQLLVLVLLLDGLARWQFSGVHPTTNRHISDDLSDIIAAIIPIASVFEPAYVHTSESNTTSMAEAATTA